MGIKELVLRMFSTSEPQPKSKRSIERESFLVMLVKDILMNGNAESKGYDLKRRYAQNWCPLDRAKDWNKWVDEEINNLKQERGIK